MWGAGAIGIAGDPAKKPRVKGKGRRGKMRRGRTNGAPAVSGEAAPAALRIAYTTMLVEENHCINMKTIIPPENAK